VIDYLDGLLAQLFSTRIPSLGAAQISFNPPDADWRTLVSGFANVALNIYLVELNENVHLRSNERFATNDGGVIHENRAPTRLDCKYLISAWSPAKAHPMTDPSSEEAVLLYQVIQVLQDNLPLDAVAVYAPSPLPAGFPTEMLDPSLPVLVAPAEPFPKLADFWMRMDTIWRPVVDLTVTIPVARAVRPWGPPVTTLIAEYGTTDTAREEELIAIGGTVRLAASGDPVPGAWVRLVELNRTMTTNLAGQFIFSGLRRGTYNLEASAPGRATSSTRPIDIPSLSGEYDIKLP
jgi:hypothetical protein